MLALLLLLLPVAFFYWYTLHEVAPWFDELYTYQYFISRGPRYTMTHWPLPNNHVLFNALSSLVAKLGVDKILVLRGVSLCSVLASTSLVFLWLRSCFGRLTGIMGALAFAFGSCAEAQGVQGRGYSLSMLLFLLALIASFYLIREA